MKPAEQRPWFVGDYAYLVPNRPTAPREAYHTPRCVIVTLPRPGTAEHDRVELELPAGKRLWTSIHNIQRRPWTPPTPQPKLTPRKRLHLATNEQETTLW